jgi:phenylalanine-4-hydroxylase
MGPVDLKAYNFYDGKWLSFEFESGIKVEGLNVTGIRNIQGKLMLIRLTNCSVIYKEERLFSPEEGDFDMVIGKSITSAFAGAADPNSFPNLYGVSKTETIQTVKTDSDRILEDLYSRVRQLRESGSITGKKIRELIKELEDFSNEWLVLLELYEITDDKEIRDELLDKLRNIKGANPALTHLIDDGVSMI